MTWPKGHALYQPRNPSEEFVGVHGISPSLYRDGCRCTPCVQANYEAQRKWRDSVRNQPVPEHVHGTLNGYKVYGCRCDRCTERNKAANDASRARRARVGQLVAAGLPADWVGDIPESS